MTPEELQEIINSVITSIRTNSRTIGQLSLVESLNDSDNFEISGGKRISYEILKLLIRALFKDDFDKIWTAINQLIKDLKAEAKARKEADEAEAKARKEADDAEAKTRKEADDALDKRISDEATARANADNLLQKNIDAEAKTRKEADDALGKRIDGVNERIEPIVLCKGILSVGQLPGEEGTYLQKDREGDLCQVVKKTGIEVFRYVPEEGIIYSYGGKSYVYNGIMLVPNGHTYFIFDGGKADSHMTPGEAIGGGNASTDFTIAKRVNGGNARFV